MYRETRLDAEQFSLSNKIIERSLDGGQNLTRAELAQVLKDAGIRASGLRLVYLIMRAELDGVICSGPRREKNFTYALLDERAPHHRNLSKKEALGELVKRYFMGHGPATIRDLSWWSGLTMNESKEELDQIRSAISREEIDGETYWFSPTNDHEIEASEQQVLLLPTYDEFLVGYDSFDKMRRGDLQKVGHCSTLR